MLPNEREPLPGQEKAARTTTTYSLTHATDNLAYEIRRLSNERLRMAASYAEALGRGDLVAQAVAGHDYRERTVEIGRGVASSHMNPARLAELLRPDLPVALVEALSRSTVPAGTVEPPARPRPRLQALERHEAVCHPCRRDRPCEAGQRLLAKQEEVYRSWDRETKRS